ncbi:MAG: DUF2157 domain-containing protein [Vampirovibrio sp.]
MDINRSDLERAEQAGIITVEQIDQLLIFLNAQTDNSAIKAKFNLTNTLYYLGALLIILAMGWFVGNVWNSYNSVILLGICLFYMTLLTLTGNYLWGKNLKIPAGLLYVATVSGVPLSTYILEKMTGLWPIKDPGDYLGFHLSIQGGWVSMELATIMAGLLFLKYRKIPFLTAPIAYAAWYMSMDIVPLLTGIFREPTWDERILVSFVFGLILMVVAFIYDKRTKGDFSFWLYLFGTVLFWSPLMKMLNGQGGLFYVLYALLNLLMMFISLFLQRKIFMVLGSLGLLIYLFLLAEELFKNTVSFPFILITIGFIILFMGVWYQKKQEKIKNYLDSLLPECIKKHLPKYR